MKRIVSLALSLLLAFTLLLSLAACGGKDEGMVNGKYVDMAAYVNSSRMQEEVKNLEAEGKEQGMDIRLTGEGNELRYTYTFAEELDAEMAAPVLEESLETQTDVFVNLAKSLAGVVAVEEPTVVVSYYNPGEVLVYTRSFTAAG